MSRFKKLFFVPRSIWALLVALASVAPLPAHAVDGCQVLLCMSSSKWREIPLCVPPVRQVMRDLAKGRPFPTCSMGGSSSSAGNQWASAPGNCPPHYTRVVEGEGSPVYSCDYSGVISVNVDGKPWTRTWWTFTGDSVTEYTPDAKATLGTWDTQFDDDYARWLAVQPPAPTACNEC